MLLILVLVLMAAALATFLLTGGVEDAGVEHAVAMPPPAAAEPVPGPQLSAVPPGHVDAGPLQLVLPREGELPPLDPRALTGPERFRGYGTLRVHARTEAGASLPDEWTLVVRPSRSLIGGGRTEERRVDRSRDDLLTVVADLPLGGYDVLVEAERMNARMEMILLAKPNGTDRTVFLDFYPAGFLTGRVAQTDGLDVEGLELVLERMGEGARRTAVTGPTGVFRFEHVLDGEYVLHIGAPENAVADSYDLRFRAPGHTLPLIEVPVLGELEIVVADLAGNFVQGAEVTGWGRDGGRIQGETDAFGVCRARHLPGGWYSVIVAHDELGSAREKVELEAGRTVRVDVTLGD